MLQTRHKPIFALTAVLIVSMLGCDRPKNAQAKKDLNASDLPGVAPKEDLETPREQTLSSNTAAETMFSAAENETSAPGLNSCLAFLKTINQEAFFYHVKGKINAQTSQVDRGLYLRPHFRFHGLIAADDKSTDALSTCAETISGIENFHQLKHVQSLDQEKALAYLNERLTLASVIDQRFPIRSCALFVDTIKSPAAFNAVKKKLSEGVAEVEMTKFLKQLNTAGANLQGRDVTARSCLRLVEQFNNYNSVLKFNQASTAEQFELLAVYALPIVVAH